MTESTKTTATRIEAIDLIKGVAIIAVVLGHVLVDQGFLNAWVYSFQVPLFFFASGLVFSAKFGAGLSEAAGAKQGSETAAVTQGATFGAFVVKKLRQLMRPYLAFGLLAIVAYQVIGSVAVAVLGRGAADLSVWDCLFGLAYGNAALPQLYFYRPLWFLPCLFVMEVLMGALLWALRGMTDPRKKATWVCVAGVVASALGFAYMRFVGTPLPWGIETACILLPFFACGQALRLICPPQRLREVLAATSKRRVIAALVGAVLLAAAVALAWLNYTQSGEQSVSYVVNNYRVTWAFFVSAALHCAAITVLCFAWGHCRPVSYLGKHTLYILGLHKYPILLCQMLPVMGPLLAVNNLAVAAVVVLISLGFSLLGEYLIKRGYTALKTSRAPRA